MHVLGVLLVLPSGVILLVFMMECVSILKKNHIGVACVLAIGLLGLLTLVGCKDEPEEAFSKAVMTMIRDGSGIDEAECKRLEKLVQSYPELTAKFPDKEAIATEVQAMAVEMNARRKNPIPTPVAITCEKGGSNGVPLAAERVFNVYLENSGSMYGYFTGNTSFKDALMDICSRMIRRDEHLNFYFVNDEINPVQGELLDFMSYLEPEKRGQLRQYGDVGVSKPNSVLRLVLDSMARDENPAVIISDYIFSLENPTSKLSEQKYTLTVMVKQHPLFQKKRFGFLIIKCASEFDGKYYDKDNPNSGRSVKMERPYYIWIVGPDSLLATFANDFDVTSIKGYRNHHIISGSRATAPYYSILTETGRVGRFELADRNIVPLHAIHDIAINRRQKEDGFQFVLALDAHNVPIPADYLLNAGNYLLESSKEVFTLQKVVPVGDVTVHDRDKRKYLGSATHLLYLRSASVPLGPQSLVIKLKRDSPQWIKDSHTEDDTDIGISNTTQDKTFGFLYVVEGVDDAFKEVAADANNEYFKLEVQFNQAN